MFKGVKRKYPLLKYKFYFYDALYDPDIIKEHLLFAGCDEKTEEIQRLKPIII